MIKKMEKIMFLTWLSLFLISGSTFSIAETDGPPVDLNKPVENPQLKAAIAKYKEDSTTENWSALEKSLNSAYYLVPIIADTLKTQPTDESGKVVVQKGSIIQFMVYEDTNKSYLLPVCTDWDEIALFTKQKVDTVVMRPSQLWDFVLGDKRQKGYQGVVVNPGSNKLELHVKDIAPLRKIAER